MQQALVTGAGGFIGSHLAELLAREGYRVRALVRYGSQGSWGWLDHAPPDAAAAIEVVAGDIRDAAGVRAAMQGCDVVFHLAALIGIPYSYRAPDSYLETNVRGTLNVLQAARELGVARLVHTSTSEVYGTARQVPITEAHPLNAQSPYAASKIAADQMALSFHASIDVPVVVARPFNTYGPRQSARAVIPTIITQILAGSCQIQLGALSPTRDLTFVQDTARGLLAAARCEQAVGEIVQLGANHEIAIGDLARLVAELMGATVEIVSTDERRRPPKSEVERLRCDNSKAQRLLGWRPTLAGRDGLCRGLRETIDWFRNGGLRDLYRPGTYVL
jgi:dTDP-glucose 4,6-dehydratase